MSSSPIPETTPFGKASFEDDFCDLEKDTSSAATRDFVHVDSLKSNGLKRESSASMDSYTMPSVEPSKTGVSFAERVSEISAEEEAYESMDTSTSSIARRFVSRPWTTDTNLNKTHVGMGRESFQNTKSTKSNLSEILKAQAEIKDHGVLTVGVILLAGFVATFCGFAAFILHLAVNLTGCLSGVNGCKSAIFYDYAQSWTPWGINKSLYFVIASSVSGLICSLIIFAPCRREVAKQCKGGGSAGTKIVISAGNSVSGWVPLLRIILAAIYLGGGNTLGTEGPIIHLSASLATWQISLLGIKSRKMLSMFAVIGAAAGISAGFNVMITGVIFTIEELTRSLSQKSALVITLAAGVATLVKTHLNELLHHYIHIDHPNLVPSPDNWTQLEDSEIRALILLCLPIGILNGVIGYLFGRCTWSVQVLLSKGWRGIILPQRSHLFLIGLLSALFGTVAYQVTGVNGVWGTTVSSINETIQMKLTWDYAVLLFFCKFIAMVLATAAGGPGGCLVPSLVAGGFVGIAIGRIASCTEAGVSACAVIGMFSLFASVMHMPVTGVIMMFELTRADSLVAHVIFANFVASNICHRLPHGEHSFVHQVLEHDPLWLKLGGQDFIETDEQEQHATNKVGIGQVYTMSDGNIKWWLMTRKGRLKIIFSAWFNLVGAANPEVLASSEQVKKNLYKMLASADENLLRHAWGGFVSVYMDALRLKSKSQPSSPVLKPDTPNSPVPTHNMRASAPALLGGEEARFALYDDCFNAADMPAPPTTYAAPSQPLTFPSRQYPESGGSIASRISSPSVGSAHTSVGSEKSSLQPDNANYIEASLASLAASVPNEDRGHPFSPAAASASANTDFG